MLAGQWVSSADIAAGRLTYTPSTDAQGATLVSFNFRVQDSGGVAFGGVDTDQSARSMRVTVGSPIRAAADPVIPVTISSPVFFETQSSADAQAEPAPIRSTAASAGVATQRAPQEVFIRSNQNLIDAIEPFHLDIEPFVVSGPGDYLGQAGAVNVVPTATDLLEMFRLSLLRTTQSADAQAADGNSFERVVGLMAGHTKQLEGDAANEQARFGLSAAEAASVAGILVSAGYITWAIRAGGLLATLFMAVPAWRNVDPLPILAPEEDKPKWTDDKEHDREEAALSRLWSSNAGDATRAGAR